MLKGAYSKVVTVCDCQWSEVHVSVLMILAGKISLSNLLPEFFMYW